jgi:hypothetical protein
MDPQRGRSRPPADDPSRPERGDSVIEASARTVDNSIVTIRLPIGPELKKALDDRGISTNGLPRNANGAPMETAMQELLLGALREERENRALKNAEILTKFTGKLVMATWAVAIASGALILATVAQVVLTLTKK